MIHRPYLSIKSKTIKGEGALLNTHWKCRPYSNALKVHLYSRQPLLQTNTDKGNMITMYGNFNSTLQSFHTHKNTSIQELTTLESKYSL